MSIFTILILLICEHWRSPSLGICFYFLLFSVLKFSLQNSFIFLLDLFQVTFEAIVSGIVCLIFFLGVLFVYKKATNNVC